METQSDKMLAENLRQVENPTVGDFWHEMFSPVAVVVGVSDTAVVLCEKMKPTGEGRWTWDIYDLHAYTRKQYANRFRYGRVGNEDFEATDDMSETSNKFWCDVVTGAHKWIADAVQ